MSSERRVAGSAAARAADIAATASDDVSDSTHLR
jgi:hypothetical protein